MRFLLNDQRLDTTKKIQVAISYFLQVTVLVALIYDIYKQEWLSVFAITGILILMSLPAILRRSYIERLPIEIDFIAILFIYATIFLGGIKLFYDKYWWWDGLMHTISGILFGVAGFLLVYVLNTNKKVHLNLSPFFIALFSLSFANVIAVLWEIFEYSLDFFFAFNMQETGLVDTMWDLIVAEAGALIVAILGFIYLRKQKDLFYDFIHRFLGWKRLKRIKEFRQKRKLKKNKKTKK
ncbi:MAG: hypothetical protein KKA62_06085 [Nanoarchaeota archaeon]|nr:hypothetical protein [Nanoarchaeota archaeon]MBU1644422.1 hypothetical protein [Nanoarchaeota archaeon]MBU1977494.1 hypothetical protein [Nanoarchaeota archaeon]